MRGTVRGEQDPLHRGHHVLDPGSVRVHGVRALLVCLLDSGRHRGDPVHVDLTRRKVKMEMKMKMKINRRRRTQEAAEVQRWYLALASALALAARESISPRSDSAQCDLANDVRSLQKARERGRVCSFFVADVVAAKGGVVANLCASQR